jgi:hypothetical protein
VPAVGAEQPTRLVDDPLQDVGRLGQGRDPSRDLAQRPLRLGLALEGCARRRELLDQAGVDDR